MSNNKLETVIIKSDQIDLDQIRLDASFYGKNAITAENEIRNSGYDIASISDLVEIRYLTRFKRTWLDDDSSSDGVPYLSASETLSFKPLRNRYISKTNIKNADNYFVKKNWILIECSGTIGVPVFVNKTLEKYFLDNHLLRLIPKENILPGFLYAYLYSKHGQILLKKGQYGSVVKEIDPRQVGPIPVPLFPKSMQQKIHEKILKANDMREKANELEEEAIKLVEETISSSNNP